MRKDIRLHNGKRGAAIAVHIIPRARRNEIVEIARDGSIKIRLNSSIDTDELNRNLVAFLAQVLSVPHNKVEIVAGLTGRSKLVSVLDMSTQAAHDRILKNLG